jgi:hypothetical protein
VQFSTAPTQSSTRVERLWALIGFSALAVFWTWPVVLTLSSRIPHDAGDPVLNIWLLWWNAQATPLTDAWWNAPMMWPMPGSMALSEHLLGLSIVATPLQWLGVSAIGAYNVCFLLTFALSGFFAFLLGRELTGSRLAGVCAGVAFACAPYRAGQLAHIQVISSQWMPLALLGLHAYLRTCQIRWLVIFGAAWLIQALSNGYYLLFFPVLLVLWLGWFVDWRRAPRQGAAIIVAWVLASLPLLPVVLKYRDVHERWGLKRTVAEIRDFSSVPASFTHAAPLIRFWPQGGAENYEQYLFTGVVVVLLGLAGLSLLLFRRTRPMILAGRAPIVFYALAAIVIGVLALGPGGSDDGPASPFRPYTWLLWLPGFNGLRVSSRFAMLSTLCLAVCASLAVAYLSRVITTSRRWRIVAAALVVLGLAADGMTKAVPVAAPPPKVILPGSPEAAVVELPLDDTDVSIQAMYRSVFHRQPLVNGYSGHFPSHYRILSLSLWRGDTSALFYLARRRPLVIVINDRLAHSGSFKQLIQSVPGIQTHGGSGAGTLYLLPAQPTPRQPPMGQPLAATVRDAGRYTLEFDVGATRLLSGVAFPLRHRYEDLAERIRIETSDDGSAWSESWLGWTGGLAVEGTLEDSQLAPIRIPLPAIRARYVRIYPASAWMKKEVTIHGEF